MDERCLKRKGDRISGAYAYARRGVHPLSTISVMKAAARGVDFWGDKSIETGA